MRTLLTDPEIKAAITQVRTYCIDIGCNFGCITKGHEWVVFRAFEPGTDWKSVRAYIIPSLEAIDAAFTTVFNALSYRCVNYDGSLNALISRAPLDNPETYRAGHAIPVYTRTIEANKYVQYLRACRSRFQAGNFALRTTDQRWRVGGVRLKQTKFNYSNLSTVAGSCNGLVSRNSRRQKSSHC